MKTFWFVLLLALGCSRSEQATTATVAPAEPRPAPTVTATVGIHPVLATAGSPRPPDATAPGSTSVTIRGNRIEMQPLLPRAHTVFHIQNETALAHELIVRGPAAAAGTSLPPHGRAVLQLLLGPGRYQIACTVPGHSERAQFETYAPGVPLNPRGNAPAGP